MSSPFVHRLGGVLGTDRHTYALSVLCYRCTVLLYYIIIYYIILLLLYYYYYYYYIYIYIYIYTLQHFAFLKSV